MNELVNAIAADVVNYMNARGGNIHGFTSETLVKNWENRIEWLGLKVGGKAWNRELLKVARNGWIATTQKTSTFIPPSEETLVWGGFLGGEFVTTPEIRNNAEAAFDARFGR